jgi:hypothetical protein
MSLAINTSDIVATGHIHSDKLPSFQKKVSRRQYKKLLTQRDRTQKKCWINRSRSNARSLKQRCWTFTQQDQLIEAMAEMEALCDEILEAMKLEAEMS